MKFKASEFMGRSEGKKVGDVPTVVVSKRAKSAVPTTAGKRDAFYKVGSLEAVVSTFDENERSLRKS